MDWACLKLLVDDPSPRSWEKLFFFHVRTTPGLFLYMVLRWPNVPFITEAYWNLSVGTKNWPRTQDTDRMWRCSYPAMFQYFDARVRWLIGPLISWLVTAIAGSANECLTGSAVLCSRCTEKGFSSEKCVNSKPAWQSKTNDFSSLRDTILSVMSSSKNDSETSAVSVCIFQCYLCRGKSKKQKVFPMHVRICEYQNT